jgi:hypothetical protein
MRSALWGCVVPAGCAGSPANVIPHEKHPLPTARFTALDTTFHDVAIEAGRAAGCDVLYQRDAFELGTRVSRSRVPGAADGSIGRFIASSGRDWQRTDELVWQFLCGMTGVEQGDAVRRATVLASRGRVEQRSSKPSSMRAI